jgi:hypothetical protein
MGKVKSQSLQAGENIVKNTTTLEYYDDTKDILYITIEAVQGSTDITMVKLNLILENRKMMFFVAIRGSVSNGHDFVDTILNLELKLSFVMFILKI